MNPIHEISYASSLDMTQKLIVETSEDSSKDNHHEDESNGAPHSASDVPPPKRLWLAILNCCIGSFVIGYALTVSNFSFQVIDSQYESSSQINKQMFQSLLSSMIPLGGSLGCLGAGTRIASKFGRRANLIISDLLIIIGSSLSLFQGSGTISYGMFIIGMAVGINMVVIPNYLLEFTGDGRVMSVHQLFIAIGIFLSYLWGLFLKRDEIVDDSTDGNASVNEMDQVDIKNRIEDADVFQLVIYVLPLILAFIRVLLFTFYYTHDTPFYYLLSKNNKKTSWDVISKFYKKQEAIYLLEFFEIKRARQIQGSTSLKDMFSMRYRNQAIVAWILNFFCYFSGVFMILLFSNECLNKVSNANSNRFRTLCIGFVLVVAQLCSRGIAGRIGRKSIVLLGQMLFFLGFLGLTIVFAFINDSTGMLDTMTLFQAVVVAGFAFQASVNHVLLSEILPERGVSAAHFVSLSSILFGAIAYPYVILLDGQLYFYMASAVFAGIGLYVQNKLVHETQGLEQYQIERLYSQYDRNSSKGNKQEVGVVDNILPPDMLNRSTS